MELYQHIVKASAQGDKLLAILIDPDKMKRHKVESFVKKINPTVAQYIFVGGSIVQEKVTESIVTEIKKYTPLPIVIFPGDVTQITDRANALLFLSLISGRNPDYLIDKHVAAVSRLKNSPLEIIPTGYILIENGKKTSVQKVSHTQPMSRDNIQQIVNTAKAGELLGMKLIYLEAGSGALHPIPKDIITSTKRELSIPLIVGGGIRTRKSLSEAYNAGADMVVIGTAFEEDEAFFEELC